MCLQNIMGKTKDVKDYVLELLKYHCKGDFYHALKDWKIPRFPLNGNDLTQNGCPSGKIMGVVMNKLKEVWVENEFRASKEDLIKSLPKIFDDLNIVDGKLVKKAKIN